MSDDQSRPRSPRDPATGLPPREPPTGPGQPFILDETDQPSQRLFRYQRRSGQPSDMSDTRPRRQMLVHYYCMLRSCIFSIFFCCLPIAVLAIIWGYQMKYQDGEGGCDGKQKSFVARSFLWASKFARSFSWTSKIADGILWAIKFARSLPLTSRIVEGFLWAIKFAQRLPLTSQITDGFLVASKFARNFPSKIAEGFLWASEIAWHLLWTIISFGLSVTCSYVVTGKLQTSLIIVTASFTFTFFVMYS